MPGSVSVKVSVKVKVKAKAKWGSVENFGGGMPPKILDTPSFGFGFDFDFWLRLWLRQSDLFNSGQRVSGLEFRKGLKTKLVSDYRSRHDDSNGPRIVKIGAILGG